MIRCDKKLENGHTISLNPNISFVPINGVPLLLKSSSVMGMFTNESVYHLIYIQNFKYMH